MKPPQQNLISTTIQTPLGTMIACADDHKLYFLQFSKSTANVQHYDMHSINAQPNIPLTTGTNTVLEKLKTELRAYFTGELQQFTIPIDFSGTAFQHKVWQQLLQVAYGTTNSYAELAAAIGNKKAYRAVANANAANRFVLIVPCHRIITSGGNCGGYNGGIEKKQWLLKFEQQNANT